MPAPSERSALSHRLSDLPFVVKAFEADDLSLDQVQVFAHLPAHLSDELADAEVMLVNAASPADGGRHRPAARILEDGGGWSRDRNHGRRVGGTALPVRRQNV